MCFRSVLQQTGNPRWDPVLRARLPAACQGLCPQVALGSVMGDGECPTLPVITSSGPLVQLSPSPAGSPPPRGNSCQLVSSPLGPSMCPFADTFPLLRLALLKRIGQHLLSSGWNKSSPVSAAALSWLACHLRQHLAPTPLFHTLTPTATPPHPTTTISLSCKPLNPRWPESPRRHL